MKQKIDINFNLKPEYKSLELTLQNIEIDYEKRKKIWEQYNKAFEDIEGLELPWEDSKQIKQSRFLYTVRYDYAFPPKMSVCRPIPKPTLGDWRALPVFSDLVERGSILPTSLPKEDAANVIAHVKSFV